MLNLSSFLKLLKESFRDLLPITVPLVAALGIGLASTIKGRNPVLDGFGLIVFASLTPMIFVQFYGIFVYEFMDTSKIVHEVIRVASSVQEHSFALNFQPLDL